MDFLYLIYGKDTFLVETMLKKIAKSFGERKEGINSIKLDDTTVNGLISDMETPAFGYEKKLIIARDTGLFKKEGKRKTAGTATNGNVLSNQIAEYLKENKNFLQQSIVLVFVEQEVEKNTLYKTIEEVGGKIQQFEELKPPQIIGKLKEICHAYQVQVEDSTLHYLIECVGTNMQDLVNEIRKLIEYVGKEGKIEKSQIDLLCVKQFESVIFDLTDQLGKRNTKQALIVLHQLLADKEPIQKILITLYHHFKKIYLTKLALTTGVSLTETLNLKPNQMFLTTKYKMQAGYFKEQELKAILLSFMDLDSDSKSGKIDIQIGLESILCCHFSK